MKKVKVYLLLLSILSIFLIKNVQAETFDGEYSVEYLLKNYNVVTLGNKTYNFPPEIFWKANISSFNEKGIVKDIYSIAGPVLVNGNYTSLENSSFGNLSNNIKSYISGTKGNNIITSSPLVTDPNYIDFNKLYLQVMNTSQALADNTEYHINDAKLEISKPGIYTIHNIAGNYGKKATDDNYYNISSNNSLIKNYDKNNLYIFNYYDEYVYYLPNVKIMESDSSNAISLRSYIESGQYTGNILFNFPNASYIKLKENAPFAGHLIAPNADVETPETHFAGCFIVNSIYGEGNTEAHFYPLTATATYEVPEYDDLTPSELSNLSSMRLKRLLGGKGSIIETTVLGDEEEFRKEEAKLNVLLDKEETKTNNSLPPIIEILQNPLTKSSIFLIISILSIIGLTIINLKKKKNN